MDIKKPWLSKTVWWNFVLAGIAFWPDGAAWVGANMPLCLGAFVVVNLVLRLVTKDKIGLTD